MVVLADRSGLRNIAADRKQETLQAHYRASLISSFVGFRKAAAFRFNLVRRAVVSKALVERYGEKAGGWLWGRFTVHYTPTHSSWLNQAEIEISLFSRQCLGRRRTPSLGDLRREARACTLAFSSG